MPPGSPALANAPPAASDAYTPVGPTELLDAVLSCVKHARKAVYDPAATVLGQALASLGGSAAADKLPACEDNVFKYLSELSMSDYTQAGTSRLLVLLDHLSEGYPRLLELRGRLLAVWARSKLLEVHGDGQI